MVTIVITGPRGSGKTHAAMALLNTYSQSVLLTRSNISYLIRHHGLAPAQEGRIWPVTVDWGKATAEGRQEHERFQNWLGGRVTSHLIEDLDRSNL